MVNDAAIAIDRLTALLEKGQEWRGCARRLLFHETR
jgi:hypothetical protein